MMRRKTTRLSYLIPAEARDSVRGMTQDRFRRIALGLPGAVEGAHMAVARARAHAEVFQLLTPEQKTQAKTLQSTFAERMKQRGRGRGAH